MIQGLGATSAWFGRVWGVFEDDGMALRVFKAPYRGFNHSVR